MADERGPTDDPPALSRRTLLVVGAGAVVAGAATVVGLSLAGRPPSSRAPLSPRPTPGVPAAGSVHISPQGEWMNDVQRPLRMNGRWHLYNLVNPDHPHGNGTSWRHFSSEDLVLWHDEGIAIEKYRNGLGDIETGSVVIDEDGVAGLGRGAAVAIVTQQLDGVQQQSLFGSADGGYRFTPSDGNPVMRNPGSPDWRDPKIVRDEVAGTWILALAEGRRIGFYTSSDLRHWTYRSDFMRDDLGTLECPDLFRIGLDGDPAKPTWVLAVSANGERHGRPLGVAYWTGHWDGERFTANGGPDAAPNWLDGGPDYYAGVTWVDDRAPVEERLSARYAVAWASNWAYARQVRLPHGGAGGPDTIVRRLTLASSDSGPLLRAEPVSQLESHETARVTRSLGRTEGTSDLVPLPAPAYRLRLTVHSEEEAEVRVLLPGGVALGWSRERAAAFVDRSQDAAAARMPAPYRDVVEMAVPPSESVELDVIADEGTLEVFCQGRAYTVLTTPQSGQASVEVRGGAVRGVEAAVTALR
ncbi:glycoside hydrolase family 32 protein [Microbacterium sp. 22242]|uniref:glycoside hydrolase family 32 protein n=1 Tax=Microbacterium sp. 22242 TaxID=3453896 RepID=UPI003F83595E